MADAIPATLRGPFGPLPPIPTPPFRSPAPPPLPGRKPDLPPPPPPAAGKGRGRRGGFTPEQRAKAAATRKRNAEARRAASGKGAGNGKRAKAAAAAAAPASAPKSSRKPKAAKKTAAKKTAAKAASPKRAAPRKRAKRAGNVAGLLAQARGARRGSREYLQFKKKLRAARVEGGYKGSAPLVRRPIAQRIEREQYKASFIGQVESQYDKNRNLVRGITVISVAVGAVKLNQKYPDGLTPLGLEASTCVAIGTTAGALISRHFGYKRVASSMVDVTIGAVTGTLASNVGSGKTPLVAKKP